MSEPYIGLIEIDLAELLGVHYRRFPISGGVFGALLRKDDFFRLSGLIGEPVETTMEGIMIQVHNFYKTDSMMSTLVLHKNDRYYTAVDNTRSTRDLESELASEIGQYKIQYAIDNPDTETDDDDVVRVRGIHDGEALDAARIAIEEATAALTGDIMGVDVGVDLADATVVYVDTEDDNSNEDGGDNPESTNEEEPIVETAAAENASNTEKAMEFLRDIDGKGVSLYINKHGVNVYTNSSSSVADAFTIEEFGENVLFVDSVVFGDFIDDFLKLMSNKADLYDDIFYVYKRDVSYVTSNQFGSCSGMGNLSVKDNVCGFIDNNILALTLKEIDRNVIDYIAKELSGLPYEINIDVFVNRTSGYRTEAGNGVSIDSLFLSSEVSEKLADFMHKDIVFGRRSDEFFSVSMSNSTKNRRINSYALGQTVTRILLYNDYSVFDFVFRDTVTNIIFAVMDKNNILITVEGVNNDEIIEAVIMRLSGALYADIVKSDKLLYDEYTEKSVSRYKSEFVKDVTESIRSKKDDLSGSKERYEALSRELMNLASKIRTVQTEINCIDMDRLKEENEELAVADYNKILSLNKVNYITYDDGLLNVYTNNIYVKNDQTENWHDIGTFHIKIVTNLTDYNEDAVSMYNTKYAVNAFNDGMNAPHVFSSGNLCHGNLTRGVADCYKNKDMFGIVYQYIIFLQSANLEDSAGKKLPVWPIVSEEIALSKDNDSEALYGAKDSGDIEDLLEDALSNL